jgi:acyl-ACP thioesterase
MNKSKTYPFQIQPQDVDFQYNVTPASLINILLTTAGYNADENGFGIRHLNEINCSWVLLRLAVEMEKFPLQYEKITVETWIENVGRASTTRNFIIYDTNNHKIGQAISNWAMIDLDTRRAQDLFNLEGICNFENNISLEMEKPMKLNSTEGKLADKFKVKYSDIDINGHASSMRYVEWISDCLSLDIYRENQLQRFEINFMNEILFGNEVSIFANEIDKNDYRFEIFSLDKTSCRARMVFSKA